MANIRIVICPFQRLCPGSEETKAWFPHDSAVAVPSAPGFAVWDPEGHSGPPHPSEQGSLGFGDLPLGSAPATPKMTSLCFLYPYEDFNDGFTLIVFMEVS